MSEKKRPFPPQRQSQPGRAQAMQPPPPQERIPNYHGCGRLKGKVALITGGDSGIERAVAILFAQEGADIALAYLEEHEDAEATRREVEKEGRSCVALAGDIGDEDFCQLLVQQTVGRFGHLDILVNNAAEQHKATDLREISREQLERTFRTSIFSMFYLTKAAHEHLREGSCVINSTSVTAYHGNPKLLDYSSTKGAIVTFTRSLALNLVSRGIRVNAVAPGPIWTPLISGTFDDESVSTFGTNTPMQRAGQPYEVAPCYLFLALPEASYITGQVLHPNGGQIVNG